MDKADIPSDTPAIVRELSERLRINDFILQPTHDGITTLWVPKQNLLAILRYLKSQAVSPYALLFDLTAIDERMRTHRQGLPDSEFTVVYHLLSFDRNVDIRLKVALNETALSLPTISDIWPSANW
jgi:NADH-quinone oxidoreductase subunit C/D